MPATALDQPDQRRGRLPTSSCSSISGQFHIATASEPTAEIDFIAKLVNKDGKIIDASTFQGTAPVSGTDAPAYVGALMECSPS